MHFEKKFASQNALNYFFPIKHRDIHGFTSKFMQGRVTLNTGIFLFGLIKSTGMEHYFFSLFHKHLTLSPS